jgi:hypothetical protein
MKRTIRHALVRYTVKKGERSSFETAFRGQTVDIPDDQVERLDALGATVLPGVVLERPGTMSLLPHTASDSEILNWVIGATEDESNDLAAERPEMAERIAAAQATVKVRQEEQNQHLGGGHEPLDDAGKKEAAEAAEFQTALDAEAAAKEAADLIGDSSTPDGISAEAADAIVDGNAKDVIEYISENHAVAATIVEAEGRRSVSRNEPVRVSIVKAAEAAAEFTK